MDDFGRSRRFVDEGAGRSRSSSQKEKWSSERRDATTRTNEDFFFRFFFYFFSLSDFTVASSSRHQGLFLRSVVHPQRLFVSNRSFTRCFAVSLYNRPNTASAGSSKRTPSQSIVPSRLLTANEAAALLRRQLVQTAAALVDFSFSN